LCIVYDPLIYYKIIVNAVRLIVLRNVNSNYQYFTSGLRDTIKSDFIKNACPVNFTFTCNLHARKNNSDFKITFLDRLD